MRNMRYLFRKIILLIAVSARSEYNAPYAIVMINIALNAFLHIITVWAGGGGGFGGFLPLQD